MPSKTRTKKYTYFLVRVKRSDGRVTTVSLPTMEMKAAEAILGGVRAIRNLAREAALEFEPGMAVSCSAYALRKVCHAVAAATNSRVQIQVASTTAIPKVSKMPKAAKKSTALNLNDAAFLAAMKPVELATLEYAGYSMSLQAMPAEVFHKLPECPVQRDTQTRAPLVQHLKRVSPVHVSVMATSVNNQLHKLDGHSRDNCWFERETLAAPPAVMCLVIKCKDFDEVRALYDQVDSVAASERLKEKVWGSWKESGYRTVTPFFASTGRFMSAIRAAFSDLAVPAEPRSLAYASLASVKALEAGKKGLGKSARPMVVAAALIVARKMLQTGKASRVAEVTEFLDRVGRSTSRVDAVTQQCDAVQLLLDTFQGVKRRGGTGSHGAELGNALAALSLWMDSSEACFPTGSLVPMTRKDYLGALEGLPVKAEPAKTEIATPATKTARRRKKVAAEVAAYAADPVAEVQQSKPSLTVVDVQVPSLRLKRPIRRPNYSQA